MSDLKALVPVDTPLGKRRLISEGKEYLAYEYQGTFEFA